MVQSNTVLKEPEWFVTAGIDGRGAFALGMLRSGLIEMRAVFRKSGYYSIRQVKERAMSNWWTNVNEHKHEACKRTLVHYDLSEYWM